MQQGRDQLMTSVITGILAVVLLGGTMALLLLGRNVPEFLVGFDGVIVTAAFANGAFFAQARAAAPTATALATSMAQHHELALAGTQTANPSATGGSVPVSSGSAS